MDPEKVYDRTAIEYDLRSGNPYTERIRDRESRLIARHASGRVLDAGCGTGYHLRALENVQGIDISGEMVSLARKTGRQVRKASVERLPFREGEFGTVLCMYSVLNLADWKKAVRELARVVRKDGKVLVSVSSLYDKGYRGLAERKAAREDEYTRRKKMHISGQRIDLRLFGKEELVEEFGKRGLELVEFDSVFRGVAPHWGMWKRLSVWERLQLFMDRFRPAEYGAFYLMAFSKY